MLTVSEWVVEDVGSFILNQLFDSGEEWDDRRWWLAPWERAVSSELCNFTRFPRRIAVLRRGILGLQNPGGGRFLAVPTLGHAFSTHQTPLRIRLDYNTPRRGTRRTRAEAVHLWTYIECFKAVVPSDTPVHVTILDYSKWDHFLASSFAASVYGQRMPYGEQVGVPKSP